MRGVCLRSRRDPRVRSRALCWVLLVSKQTLPLPPTCISHNPLGISTHVAVKAYYPVIVVYYNDIISLGNTDCFLNIGYLPGHF